MLLKMACMINQQNTDNVFVCLGFFVPLGEFFTHMKTSPFFLKGCKF